jgi:hypothetical protein
MKMAKAKGKQEKRFVCGSIALDQKTELLGT